MDYFLDILVISNLELNIFLFWNISFFHRPLIWISSIDINISDCRIPTKIIIDPSRRFHGALSEAARSRVEDLCRLEKIKFVPIDVYVSGKDSTDVLTGKIGEGIQRKRWTRNTYRDRFSERNEKRSVDGVATRGDETRQRRRPLTFHYNTWRSLRLYFRYISKIGHGTFPILHSNRQDWF